MKQNSLKKVMSFLVIMTLCITPIKVYADSSKVVTIGADLSQEKKDVIMDYFGVKEDEVEIIEVTNQDERKYMEGIATEQQIGTHTYSCSYIEPTNEGGIHIKTANLNWVTCEMIRNALITSGITNCNVVSAAPMEVSGTGALTGIFMAYEQVAGEELDQEKMEIASEELITTLDIAGDVGQEEASSMVEELKEDVIEGEIKGEDEISEIIDNYTSNKEFELTPEQKEALINLLLKIANQDYDINKIKQAYQDIEQTVQTIKEESKETLSILDKIKSWFKGLFSSDEKETSEKSSTSDTSTKQEESTPEIFNTNDSILGNAIVTATDESDSTETDLDAVDGNIDSQDETENSLIKTLKSLIEKLTSISKTATNESAVVNTEETHTENNIEEPETQESTEVLDKVTFEMQEETYSDSAPSLDSLTE